MLLPPRRAHHSGDRASELKSGGRGERERELSPSIDLAVSPTDTGVTVALNVIGAELLITPNGAGVMLP